MKKIIYILSIFLFLSIVSFAQAKTYKISVNQFVEHPALDAVLKGFQDSFKDGNIKVKYSIHNAQANMATANQIANQIVGEDADLVLAIATPSAQACAQAIKKAPHMQRIPLLFSAITDPISAGLVKSLTRPGKNITGVSDLLPMDKHMDMVMTFFPRLNNLGVIYNAGEANSKKLVKMMREEGKKRNFNVVEAAISKSSEVYQATKGLVGRCDAVYVPTDNTVVSALESVVKVCIQSMMPLFAADTDSVKRGAVAAMGFDYYKHGRQTGDMAIRILKGQNPATTAVETQEELKLFINLKYAKKMGVKTPKKIISRADKIFK